MVRGGGSKGSESTRRGWRESRVSTTLLTRGERLVRRCVLTKEDWVDLQTRVYGTKRRVPLGEKTRWVRQGPRYDPTRLSRPLPRRSVGTVELFPHSEVSRGTVG